MIGAKRNSRSRRGATLLLLALVSLALVAGLYLGRRMALQEVAAKPAEGESVAQEALAGVRAELEISVTRHGVDRQALEIVRGDMATQNEQIAALEEDLRFYRSLMAPEATVGLISLSQPVFQPGAQPGQYDYRLVIRQRASKHVPVKGSLVLTVTGLQAGEPSAHSLQSLSRDTSRDTLEEPLQLNFRYFQTLEGTIYLPEGFEPRSVEVVATLSKPKKSELQENFPWQRQE